MLGRKPLYRPETLEIGEKLTLPRDKRKFGYQYARNFNKRTEGKKFKFVEGAFIERVI